MFCPNCGAQLEEGAKFCPACGTQIQQQAAPAQEPVYTEPTIQQPVYTQTAQPQADVNTEARETGKKNMILAIVGCALACFPYAAIAGFIISIIAKGKNKQYVAKFGEPTGMAKVAHILATIGFILGIVMMVVTLIYIIVGIAGCAAQGIAGELENELNNYNWNSLFQ